LYDFLAIAVLLDAKTHASGRITSTGMDQASLVERLLAKVVVPNITLALPNITLALPNDSAKRPYL